MDFVLTDDQLALQQELRRLLSTPVGERTPGVDRDLWRALGEMGVFSLVLPETDGGVGLGWADAAVVFEELGRAAVPGPVVDTFLAAGLVEGAATGEAVVGITPAGGPALVEHLADVDVLLVDHGDRMERLKAVPDGVAVARPTDPLTPVSVVERLPAGEVMGAGPSRDRGGLLVAAVQVGLAQSALDLAVAYAKDRQQFGRVIGSFQALKHILADAAVGVDVARAGVHAAAVSIDEGTATPRVVAGARVVASAAADRATRTSIQVHGGMGYTWELDAHLYLKRSLVLDVAHGGVDDALDEIADALG